MLNACGRELGPILDCTCTLTLQLSSFSIFPNLGYKEMSVRLTFAGYNYMYSIDSNLTCQSSALQCLFVLRPAYSDPCRTEHSSNQHRMDGYPGMKNQMICTMYTVNNSLYMTCTIKKKKQVIYIKKKCHTCRATIILTSSLGKSVIIWVSLS